jgi:hypothetical protein
MASPPLVHLILHTIHPLSYPNHPMKKGALASSLPGLISCVPEQGAHIAALLAPFRKEVMLYEAMKSNILSKIIFQLP